MKQDTKETLQGIGIVLAIIAAFWPALVLPFYGVSFTMALFCTGLWLVTVVSAAPFVVILVGFSLAFLAAFAGVEFHTDTAEASIQRARLLDRGYTTQYYKPVEPTSYDPTWDEKGTNYQPR